MVTSALALAGVHAVRLTFWQPPQQFLTGAVLLVFFCAPLLVCLPGAWRGVTRDHLLLAFLSLMYFMHAVLAAFDPTTRTFGVLALAAVGALFVSVLWWLRGQSVGR